MAGTYTYEPAMITSYGKDRMRFERMKHRWDQEQHSLTHTLVIRDSADVKQGDYLTTAGRTFLILLSEDPGNLGATGLIYLEERNDLK